MIYEKNWEDCEYSLLDASDGSRLERWGKYILIRPDPQAIWSEKRSDLWGKADAVYKRSDKGGGYWDFKTKLPDKWQIKYSPLNLSFEVSPMGFKHTGVFPEQAINWNFMHDVLASEKIPLPGGVPQSGGVVNK